MGSLSNKLPYPLMLTQWSATLNPLLKSPIANPIILSNVSLASGQNTINHTLGQTLVGYMVILNSASATFYDGQNTNPTPDKTLVIYASAATKVSILVF